MKVFVQQWFARESDKIIYNCVKITEVTKKL
jgi:hypothetical protein